MADVTPVQVVEGFLDAMNELDLAGMLGAVFDDFTLELPTAPEGVPRETTPKAQAGTPRNVWRRASAAGWRRGLRWNAP